VSQRRRCARFWLPNHREEVAELGKVKNGVTRPIKGMEQLLPEKELIN